MVYHVYVQFSDPSCIGFCDIVWKKKKQTKKRKRLLYDLTPGNAGVGRFW